ncbi:MAG: outer membrane beta-barrel protein [SAR324 cluster bacterium]|nr:outer membrane beta-barrel protein [SAR324 cluster bacterium]
MKSTRKILGGLLAIAFFLVAVWPAVSNGREGFYLGAGGASQSVSGDLDGTKNFSDSSGNVLILAGKPESGSGIAILIGFGFNENIAFEYLFTSTSHASTHSFIKGDNTSNATLTAALFGARVTLPVGESLEIFGRLGLGVYSAEFETFALSGRVVAPGVFLISSRSSAEFSGSGLGLGLGVEFFLGSLGIEAGATIHNADFDEATGAGTGGTLPSALSTTITTANLIIAYHFGSE